MADSLRFRDSSNVVGDASTVEPSRGVGVRPKRAIIKTVMAAVILFAVGSVMLWLGSQALFVDRDRGIAMLVLGSLTFIPGSYATWTLIGAWCRWRNYHYSDLPSYDDD